MAYTYEYPRPAVTVDIVLFDAAKRSILMIRRKHDPFAGSWALPGGFVDENEPLAHAAARELEEETGMAARSLEQVGAFGDPGRDPRGHTVSVAYWGLAKAGARPVAADDAADAQWVPLSKLTGRSKSRIKTAFDHDVIIALALGRLRSKKRR